MKGRILYSWFFYYLCLAGLTAPGFAQTIVVNKLTPGAVCPGNNVSVPFSTTGAFGATNVFRAQLSDASGNFSASPTVIGTLALSPILPTNATISATIPKSAAAGSAYKVRIVSSAPARTSSNTQPLTINATPGPPSTSTPPQYCEGEPAEPLVATPSSGGTLEWYGTDPNSTPTSKATVPNTNLVGTTPYYVGQNVDGCSGAPTSIAVTVNDKPNAPGTSPKTYCVGDVASPLSASPVSGATLNWYTTATGGTPSSVAPTPNTTKAGSTTYYVSQTLKNCEGPRATLVVTVSTPPNAPKATTPDPTCQDAPTKPLTAVPDAGATLRWWGTSATGGTFTTTPTVPSNQASDTYYVSQEKGGCDGPRTAILVTIKPLPAPPTTSPAPSYCQSATATALSASPSAGGTLNWYGANSTGGTSTTLATTPSTTSAGSTNYYVSQTVGGCESPRAAILVIVKALPSAPATVSPTNLCQSKSAAPLTASPSTGGTLNWYGTNASGGTPSETAPTPPTSATGSTTYYVSQSVNGCEGPRASLRTVVYAVPAQPTAVAPAPYCEGTQATSLSAVGQNLRWYGTNPTGGTPSSTPTVPNTNLVGKTNYYVTQTTNGCESDPAAIPVQVKDTPNAPGVTGVDFCQNYPAPALSANFAANTTPNWYGTNSTGGTASPNAPVPGNTNAGRTTYYVSQTLEGCESVRAGLTVNVKTTPAAPGVSPIGFCNNGPSQQLVAAGINGSTIKWYDATDKLLDGAPIPATNTVGDQLFKATQVSSEGCESREKANLVVTIKPLPGPPSVANVAYCQSQPDQPEQNVAPLTANGQNLRWYNTDGNLFPTAPTPPISQTGVLNYQVSQTVNGCEGGKATLQATINTTPAPTVARSLVSYCINDKATPLQATAETNGSLRWIDPYGRVTPDAPVPATTNANVTPGGDPFYVYQIGANGCYSPRSTIRVVVNTTPTLALTGSVSVNLGQRAPLALKFTGAPPFSYTLTGGYSGISNSTDTTIQVLPRNTTTYQVAAVSNSCGNGLPGNPATAIVTVRVPTITTAALSSATLCSGNPLTVPFTTTGTFTNGNQFRVELVSVADTSKKFEVSAGATGSPIVANLPVTLASGDYYVRVKASNPEIGIVGSNSQTVLTVHARPSATLTGTQSIYEGTPANLTVTFGGEGPWNLTYADSIQTYSLVTNVNPFTVEVRPAHTTTYRIVSLSNNCGTGPVSGTATVSILTVLGVEDPNLGPLVNVYPVPTATLLTVDIDASLARDPAVLSLTDSQGRPIMQQTTYGRRTELDLSSQPAGLYLLRVQVGDRQTVRKVLKQ